MDVCLKNKYMLQWGTAPGTLGIYQLLNSAWLAGLRTHAGITNNREEPLLPFTTFIEIITHYGTLQHHGNIDNTSLVQYHQHHQ